METGERLAAYLAGELDTDETAAVEAELARDPRLRRKLEHLRATDAALASLPTVEPPAGFPERLRDAVAAELDRQLPADGDELGARRARGTTGTRSWWPQIAVAAVVLAVAGIGIAQLGSGGADSGEAGLEEFSTMETEAAAPAAGPTVVAAGRSFDADTLRELADDARFDDIVGQGLEGDDAAIAAESFEDAIQDDADAAGGAERAADGAETSTLESADEPAPAAGTDAAEEFGLRTVGEVSEEDLEAVRACLPALLEAQTAVIPVYAELVTFDGQDAIVYGLVGNDPAQESYSRVELWVLGRGDCHVLHYTQVDR
ncbi:MAG: hypothetical protein KY461_00510 [Actinobacteria bacterium]|nr:hypothetical protein [Actinomycetota bacterium]